MCSEETSSAGGSLSGPALDEPAATGRGANVLPLGAPVTGGPGGVLGGGLRAGWCRPLRQVEAYWQARCVAGQVPPRSAIDPRGIEAALHHAFVAEEIAPGHARLRLGGSHLCDLMGMEVRGMPLSALITPRARPRLSQALTQVFAGPARAVLTLAAERRLGKPALAGRLLLLPLSDDLGRVTRALGCLVTDGRIGRAPRRFEALQTEVAPLGRPDAALFCPPERARPASAGPVAKDSRTQPGSPAASQAGGARDLDRRGWTPPQAAGASGPVWLSRRGSRPSHPGAPPVPRRRGRPARAIARR